MNLVVIINNDNSDQHRLEKENERARERERQTDRGNQRDSRQ